MTETVRKQGGTTFYLAEDMLDAVMISVPFAFKIEAVSAADFMQWCRTIDEKCGIVDVVSLTKLGEKPYVKALFLVDSSFVCSNSFVSGSTAAYSQ